MNKQLQKFVDEDKYIFHGGPDELETLEPRQAFNFVDGKHEKDGEPAIFASPNVDYAIFMALINKKNCPKKHHSSVGIYNGIAKYSATKETLEQLHENTSGFVHVFPRDSFKRIRQAEWVSHASVQPIAIIEVTIKDFEPGIEIIP